MSETSSSPVTDGGFRVELRRFWESFPNRWLFGALLLAWVAVFYFLGSPSLGYRELRTPNLFFWMYYAYTNPGSEDTHGLLVLPGVLLLLWWKRASLIAAPKEVWLPALAGLLLAGLLHVLGFAMQQQRVSIIALCGGVYSLVALVWGPRLAARCFFPFVLFAYLIPVGMMVDTLTLPLRLASTDISVFIARFVFGIEVIKDGVRIMDPGGTYQYEVAAACSGLRSLIALSALTLVYGFMNFSRPWKQWIVVCSAVPIALGGNIIRLLTIILAAESFGEGAGHFVHEWFGFVTFLVAVCILMLMGWLLRERADVETPRVEGMEGYAT